MSKNQDREPLPLDHERGHDKELGKDYNRSRDRDRARDRSRDRERGRDRSRDRERGDRSKDGDVERDRYRERPREGDRRRQHAVTSSRGYAGDKDRPRWDREGDRSRSPDSRARKSDRPRHSRRYGRSHSRSRSRSPRSNGRNGEGRSGDCTSPENVRRKTSGTSKEMEANLEDEDEEAKMARLMGFSSLTTTKGKHVAGNNEAGTVDVVKVRTWRQYMNRRGGFNRPLDKV